MNDSAAEYVDIDKIKAWEDNPRENDAAVLKVADSIKRFGFGAPLLVRKSDGVIIAGHTRYEASKLLGLSQIPCRYMDLDPVDSRLLALADNKLGELSTWDNDKLSHIIADLNHDDLLNIGFSDDELDALINAVDDQPQLELVEHELEYSDTTHSELGEIYELGDHLLMCGDSLEPTTYKRLLGAEKIALVHADPPYGMGKEKDGVANDNLYNENLDAFLDAWISAVFDVCAENASLYVWGNAYDLWRWYMNSEPIKEQDIHFRNEIVWNKKFGMGMNSDVHRMYPTATERCLFFMLGVQEYNTNADQYWQGWEPIRKYLLDERLKMGWSVPDMKRAVGHSEKSLDHWTTKSQWCFPTRAVYEAMQRAAKKEAFDKDYDVFAKEYRELKKEYDKLKLEFMNSRSYFDNTHDSMTDVWEYERVSGDEREGHPTPKPVEMIKRIILSSCPKDAIVLDPFGGSGSTLIASAEAGRTCRMIELDPRWCDVIRRRWTKYAKQHNIKIGTGGLEQ